MSQTAPPSLDPGTGLLSILASGLQRHAEIATAVTLGDRSRYIGLSDIGRGLDCFRATVADKLPTAHPPFTPSARAQAASLSRQLTLQRGHCFESLVGQALASHRLNTLHQLEIDVVYQGTPIKAHLDFVLVSDVPGPTVRILECKSTKHLPETLYASYESQVYGQVGLLKAAWNSPAFYLRDPKGTVLHAGLTFPELCHVQFGLTLPNNPNQVDLEAWVLCLSMTNAKVFGPYRPHQAMLALCLKTAGTIWQHLQDCLAGTRDIDSLPTATGCHPLCSFCDWNTDCPKFDGPDQPGWEGNLQELVSLKAVRSALAEAIQEKEEAAKTAYALTPTQGGWIRANSYRFKVAQQAGRRSLDKDKLRLELIGLTGSHDEADQLLARCQSQGQPCDRLTISPINSKCTATPQRVAPLFQNPEMMETAHARQPV
ncbi:hypothetical protein G3N56_03730 [Desulfovibrio sulfodismutans]|uniref:Uncharacterized protein n=1 Tax=Desulfolutivibrio sulfodismutans TaxID=63561 RepID=A0A7K3NI17_9BACT|nr:hypothetical protein [Desulfolutivibrio sulfodismutans]NDY55851.1 hypothetical protein [Desulfolutivibrio sulfodismutans]QLA14253.1 hypothetical protein GD606_19270 [Desulfolutivibrio sulfodismutans DSM 3696]